LAFALFILIKTVFTGSDILLQYWYFN